MTELSKAAERALRGAAGHHVGAEAGLMTGAVMTELHRAGMVTDKGCLTRKGSILAQRLKREEEDRLFPL